MGSRSKLGLLAVLIAALLAVGGAASAYEVTEVSNGGSVKGRITLKGEPTSPKIFKVDKTPEVCGEDDRLLQEVRVKDGGLADVVIALEGIEKGKPYSEVTIEGPEPGARSVKRTDSDDFPGMTIRPKTCNFGSFTGVVADGKLLRFRNQDPVKHSPHTYAVKGKVRNSMHNQDLEGDGELDLEVKFKKKTQKALKLECDQHNHMQNWFYRVDNPYFAFSGDDGTFSIEGVPPGTYKLIAWHPKFKEKKQSVTVDANGKVDVNIEFVSKVKTASAK